MRKKRWRKDLKEINVEQENVVKGLEDVEKDEKLFLEQSVCDTKSASLVGCNV